MKKFVITDSFKFGWEKTKNNYAQVLSVILIFLFFIITNNLLDFLIKNNPEYSATLVYIFTKIAFMFLSLIVGINVIKEGLVIVRGGVSHFRKIFVIPDMFWKFIFGQILSAIIILAGLISFIVPGIIIAFRLFFIKQLIVDKNLYPIDAVKKAFDMTRGWTWQIFLFVLSLAVVNIAGALLIGIGLFVTIPMSFFAILHVYDIFLNGGLEHESIA